MKHILQIICVFQLLAVSRIQSQSILYPQEYYSEQIKRCRSFDSVDFRWKNKLEDAEKRPHGVADYSSLFPNNSTYSNDFDNTQFKKEGRKWFPRKLLEESWVDYSVKDTIAGEPTDFRIVLNPVFNFQAGRSNDAVNANVYTNTRGLTIKVEVNKNFKFESSFMENQSVFMSNIANEVKYSKDVLGQGRWKTFKTNGFDYAMASGVFWWKPAKWFEIYGGHGKQKIGTGYRSLLLSDQAFNYPYARFDFTWNKAHLKYTSTYALLMNLTPTVVPVTPQGTEALLQKKPFSFQYLSWEPLPMISVGLFQGMVWKPTDSQNKFSLDGNFFNPVMFANSGLHPFNAAPKVLLGADINFKITKKLHLYGQLATDGKKEYYNDLFGYAVQAGIKAYDAFTVKNLFIQAEYNTYRNNVYHTNSVISVADYSHYNSMLGMNQPLTDGDELSGIAIYRYKRLMMNGRATLLSYYYLPDQKRNALTLDGRLSYIINSSSNMMLSAGLMGMNYNNGALSNALKKNDLNAMIYFSFKTALYNVYLN